jgi:hypothetical protein
LSLLVVGFPTAGGASSAEDCDHEVTDIWIFQISGMVVAVPCLVYLSLGAQIINQVGVAIKEAFEREESERERGINRTTSEHMVPAWYFVRGMVLIRGMPKQA